MDESEPRGSAAEAWQIPYLLERGLSLMTAPRNQLFPDRADGRAASIYRLFLPAVSGTLLQILLLIHRKMPLNRAKKSSFVNSAVMYFFRVQL